jgi:hypothetical protein
MKKVTYSNNLLPSFITQGNVRYERNFIDVNDMEDGYIKIPIYFDTTDFAILYDLNNINIQQNLDCIFGCFFVPFIPCATKEELTQKIARLVVRLGNAIVERRKIAKPVLKVFVYRYIDPNGKRFFAIAGSNLNPKSEKIHNLNIKTLLSDTIPPDPILSWGAVVDELSDLNQTPTCIINKEDVLDFESRKAIIRVSCDHALAFLPKSSSFFAQHLSGKGVSSFFNKEIGETCKIFGLKKDRVSSSEEFNILIKKMIESFRELTGMQYVETTAIYTETEGGSLDISIASFEGQPILFKKNDVEEDF